LKFEIAVDGGDEFFNVSSAACGLGFVFVFLNFYPFYILIVYSGRVPLNSGWHARGCTRTPV
jgi:hypothetical protein